ncbi:MAG: GIY-YIG nuclease family protein [Sphingobacterium sp.]
MNKRGITVTNYLATGNPEGIIFSYMSNWTGQAIKIPRNLFLEAKELPELKKPGIYFLFGQNDENPDDKLVYVGEANSLADRIGQHFRNTDQSFELIVCFCSKDENLTVSHTKYLEQKTISRISKSSEYRLTNKTVGTTVNLPIMVRDEMDTYFDNMQIVLPTLGYSVLTHDDRLDKKSHLPSVEYSLSMSGVTAKAVLTSNGIEVLKGSEMSKKQYKALSGTYGNLRNTLLEKEIVILKDGKNIFNENYEFSSPSTAGAVILGYSVNGRTAWKDKNGITIKENEELKIGGNQ